MVGAGNGAPGTGSIGGCAIVQVADDGAQQQVLRTGHCIGFVFQQLRPCNVVPAGDWLVLPRAGVRLRANEDCRVVFERWRKVFP